MNVDDIRDFGVVGAGVMGRHRRQVLQQAPTTEFTAVPTNRAIPRLLGRYRRGPANGRESIADENVPVPGPPVESSCFMSAVAKLRLDDTPTPRSLGGSDEEAASTDRCGQERIRARGSATGCALMRHYLHAHDLG